MNQDLVMFHHDQVVTDLVEQDQVTIALEDQIIREYVRVILDLLEAEAGFPAVQEPAVEQLHLEVQDLDLHLEKDNNGLLNQAEG